MAGAEIVVIGMALENLYDGFEMMGQMMMDGYQKLIYEMDNNGYIPLE